MVIKDLMSVTMTGKKASNVPIIVVNRDLYANIMIMSLAALQYNTYQTGRRRKGSTSERMECAMVAQPIPYLLSKDNGGCGMEYV